MKKFKPVRKYDGKDLYIFVGGVADVPGMFFKGKHMTVSLKEFNALKRR